MSCLSIIDLKDEGSCAGSTFAVNDVLSTPRPSQNGLSQDFDFTHDHSKETTLPNSSIGSYPGLGRSGIQLEAFIALSYGNHHDSMLVAVSQCNRSISPPQLSLSRTTLAHAHYQIQDLHNPIKILQNTAQPCLGPFRHMITSGLSRDEAVLRYWN